MEGQASDPAARKIESLTRNLLECYEELDLIYRLSRSLNSTLDIQRNAETVLAEAMEIFEADTGWVVPAGAPEGSFRPVIRGIGPAGVARLEAPLLQGLIAEGRSRIFYSLSGELGVPAEGLPAALLCAVVRTDTATYGALCVGRHGPDTPFTAGDLKLAGVLASQAAISIENTLLHRRRMEEEQALIRMQEEMRLARDIQGRLLPKGAPRVPGYEVAGCGLPAQTVGGDYYDFINVNGGQLAVCLADISGKGLPAALLMANLQATIRGQALMNAAPGECMRRSNRLLFKSTDADRFATCFYGILHPDSHHLRYCNAGHDHPILFHRRGGHSRLESGGLVLGIFEDTGFEERSAAFDPGDILLLYSDGITEAFNSEGREFGAEGIIRSVERRPDAPAGEILDGLLEAVREHTGGGPQADDMTLMVIRRLPG